MSGPNIGLIFDRPVWVGSIRDRHKHMHCDWYLWNKSEDIFGQEMVDATVERVNEFLDSFRNLSCIHLRYTGRTDLTLAAFTAFTSRGVSVVVEFFDHKKRRYLPLSLPGTGS